MVVTSRNAGWSEVRLCNEQNKVFQIDPSNKVMISRERQMPRWFNNDYLISSAVIHQRGKKPAAPRRDRIRASVVLNSTQGMLTYTQDTQRSAHGTSLVMMLLLPTPNDDSSMTDVEVGMDPSSYLSGTQFQPSYIITQTPDMFRGKRIEWGIYMLQTNLQHAFDHGHAQAPLLPKSCSFTN